MKMSDQSQNSVLIPWDDYQELRNRASANGIEYITKMDKDADVTFLKNEIRCMQKSIKSKDELVTAYIKYQDKLMNRNFFKRIFNTKP